MKIRLSRTFSFISVLVLTLALSASLSIFNSPSASAATPKTAVNYGDSLTWESYWAIDQQFAKQTGWKNHIHAFPGTAPCDWNQWLASDLATYQPSVVSILTAGNTSKCMVDAKGKRLVMGSRAYYAKYRADLNQFFAAVTATGAKVVFFKAPPFKDRTRNAAVIQITNIATSLAGKYQGVSVAGSVRAALSNGGKYTTYKPCLVTEKAAQGCSKGVIPIRTLRGVQAGLHLCAAGLPAAYPWFCRAYSSGEYRFGTALANSTINPPAPILP